MIDNLLQNYGQIIAICLLQTTLILILFIMLSITIYKNKHVTKYNFLLLGLILIIFCPIISNQFNLFKLNIPITIQPTVVESSPIINSEIKKEVVPKTNNTGIDIVKTETESIQKEKNISLKTISDKNLNTSAIVEPINRINSIAKFAFILWLLGFLFFTFKSFFGFIRINRIIINCLPLLNREILKNVDTAIRSLNIKSQPQILISQHTGSPFVTGIINPKIIIPHILIENFDEDSFKSILFHELAHIKRNDLAKGLLQIFIQNILWFHPLIYLYNKEMNFSREEVCDNYSLSQHQPKCYASILTKLAEAQINKNNFSGVNSMISSKGELFNRVKNILNPNRSISTKMTLSDLLSLSLILLISIFTVGSLQLVKAEESTKQKANLELTDDFLDQKVTLNFTKASTLQDFINLLKKSNNLKISIHESLSNISKTNNQKSLLIAQNMALKDVLSWINLTFGIDYAINNNEVVFCSPELKDIIDTKYYLESFSLEKILTIANKDQKNEKDVESVQFESNNIKELIMDKIARDTWDEANGRSIECFSNKVLITHNKATLKKIKQFLDDLELSFIEINDPNFIPTFNKPETLIEKSIQASLNKNVSYKFQSNQFNEILEEISKGNNISFFLILDSIESFEKLNHEKINLEIKDQPLNQVLKNLLEKNSLDSQIINGAFYISSDTVFDKILTLERYNTKLICQKDNSLTTEDIMNLILNKLNRSSWDFEKGTSIVSNNGQLLVTHNKKMHALISEFLKGLAAGKVDLKLPDKSK